MNIQEHWTWATRFNPLWVSAMKRNCVVSWRDQSYIVVSRAIVQLDLLVTGFCLYLWGSFSCLTACDMLRLGCNRLLPSSKNPHLQNEARCTAFLVKMSFIWMRMKNDSILKAVHLPSFWSRGPGELRNGLFPRNKFYACLRSSGQVD